MPTIKTASNLRWNSDKTAIVCDLTWEEDGNDLFGGKVLPCTVDKTYGDQFTRLTSGEFGPVASAKEEVLVVSEETLESRLDTIARDWGFRSFVEATTYTLSKLDIPQKRKAVTLIEFRDKILAGEAGLQDKPEEVA